MGFSRQTHGISVPTRTWFSVTINLTVLPPSWDEFVRMTEKSVCRLRVRKVDYADSSFSFALASHSFLLKMYVHDECKTVLQ